MRITVQIELVYDLQQSRSTKNLLCDGLQSPLQVVINVGHHVVGRHRRLLNQDQRRGLVTWGQYPTGAPNHYPAYEQRDQEVQVPAPHNSQQILNVETR